MKKRSSVELRFYELPHNKDVISLLGSHWIREYGLDDKGIPLRTNHFHNLMEIGVCREGNGILVYDQKRYKYQEGTITIIPKNYPHNTKNDTGQKSFWEYLFLDPERFFKQNHSKLKNNKSKLIHEINQGPLILNQYTHPQLYAIINLIMDQEREQSELYLEMIQGLVYSMLIEISRVQRDKEMNASKEDTVSDEYIQMLQINKSIDYIHDNYMNSEIKISEIAKVSSISETYFRRLFVRYFQMSPLVYLNLVRIHAAIRLLATTNYSLEVIAKETGFFSVSSLIRNFKRYIGETPYQWKKKSYLTGANLMEYRISVQNGWQ